MIQSHSRLPPSPIFRQYFRALLGQGSRRGARKRHYCHYYAFFTACCWRKSSSIGSVLYMINVCNSMWFFGASSANFAMCPENAVLLTYWLLWNGTDGAEAPFNVVVMTFRPKEVFWRGNRPPDAEGKLGQQAHLEKKLSKIRASLHMYARPLQSVKASSLWQNVAHIHIVGWHGSRCIIGLWYFQKSSMEYLCKLWQLSLTLKYAWKSTVALKESCNFHARKCRIITQPLACSLVVIILYSWWVGLSFCSSLIERYNSASLSRHAGVSSVEFQAASLAAKQHPHFQQVLWASGLSCCQAD